MKNKTTTRTLALVSLIIILWLAAVAIHGKQVALTASDHSPGPLPVRWEHGWKTDRVIATRYLTVNAKGYNIGFRFPKNPYHGNSAEVFEFYQKHGGVCWLAGSGPQAEQFVSFKSVHDSESADKKLQEILPPLSELLEDLDRL